MFTSVSFLPLRSVAVACPESYAPPVTAIFTLFESFAIAVTTKMSSEPGNFPFSGTSSQAPFVEIATVPGVVAGTDGVVVVLGVVGGVAIGVVAVVSGNDTGAGVVVVLGTSPPGGAVRTGGV